MTKRTKIIATVGPASAAPETLRALAEAGVDVFRINFSHGDESQRAQFLADIRAVEAALQRPVAVCADLCGPKIRVGMIPQPVQLEVGQEVVVHRDPIEGSATDLSTTLPELVDVVGVGEQILLADGRLRLEVIQIAPPQAFTCRVKVGGELSSGKGVNLPETDLPISVLTEKDRQDIRWIVAHDFDYVALSFARSAADVQELRKLLSESGCTAHIITKIEKPQAAEHIDMIIAASDALMVARGDLGVEMDFPRVPIVQKLIAQKCQAAGKPCIIATEMLESMIQSPRPTRAEVSDVANAVFDHADAVMLSGESSIGRYPVEAVTAMQHTVVAAEIFLDERRLAMPAVASANTRLTAVAASVRQFLEQQAMAAVALFMVTGTRAQLLSKYRLTCPILGLSDNLTTLRRACLYYGVIPQQVVRPEDIQALFATCTAQAKACEVASSGEPIIILAGPPVYDSIKGLVIDEVP